MTDLIDNPTPALIGVPPLEELAVATVHALAGDGYTSSVMKLSQPVLNELARRLVTPGNERIDTLDWLRNEKGIAASQMRDYTLDRFFQRFREKFKGVQAEARNQAIIAQMAADPDFDNDDLQRFIKNKTIMVIAQEMAGATPEDIDTGRLKAVLSLISAADQGKLEVAKLALASEQADHRNAKLEADLALSVQQADHRERELVSKLNLAQQKLDGLPAKVKALQTRIDELSKDAQRGRKIDPAVFDRIRAELSGLTKEAA